MQVDPFWMLILEALLFALAFGALSWLRGEGLPIRFAWEVVAVTAVCLLLCGAGGLRMHPVVFLTLVYLVTMRARLLVDLGNALSARGRYERALAVFELGSRLAGDGLTRAMVGVNVGVVHIRQQRFEEAIALLTEVLGTIPEGRGGPKLTAACRYNLGLAYLRAGEERKAVQQFSEVIELMPNSLYARGAASALKKARGQG